MHNLNLCLHCNNLISDKTKKWLPTSLFGHCLLNFFLPYMGINGQLVPTVTSFPYKLVLYVPSRGHATKQFSYIYVPFCSNKRVILEQPHNFEPRSDDAWSVSPSPNFRSTQAGGVGLRTWSPLAPGPRPYHQATTASL
ncbi:hypothetical protein AVEN_116256-1 [Araneus ventricosus]|uniref:Uncharacterized protein n=1 Tax=Araneus ventricosus TaxID=182803 RepID=A0A4Y2P8C1_ARAVE|nr:hypothetical protein AVEN_16638-1 [Araneus ventricosus]GBN48209.1 hypothetical protein AVEN_116256-1 [Araneus ventricosus]